MTTFPPALTVPTTLPAWLIAAIVAVGIAARLGVMFLWPETLLADTDAYLAYAKAWAETGTFGYEGQPTAFRPPLYPWLLSLFGSPTAGWVASINLLSSGGTIVLIWLTAKRLGLSDLASSLAASLIAIDPLLVRYAGQAMTECLCTFESALLLWLFAHVGVDRFSSDEATPGHSQWPWSLAAGVVLGMSVLTRPTFLVFAGLLVVASLIMNGLRKESSALSRTVVLVVGVAIPVTGWGVRNQMLLGSPIITTTHGGYTLLLGNNESYYREVVDQPRGTLWDGRHGEGQQLWVQELNRSLDLQGVTGEVARDRAMRDAAIASIQDQPLQFVRACLRRLLAFWSIVPSGEARTGLPIWLMIVVGVFYLVWWLWSTWGLTRTLRDRVVALLPALCLVASFATVHLVYWSNARMRAPVLPALALLAAVAVNRKTLSVESDPGSGRQRTDHLGR